jgi:hypothetical protein
VSSDAEDRELDEFSDVLAYMSPEAQPPADLEDRMVSAALARRPASATAPRARSRTRVALLAATAVAASIVIAVLVTTRDTSTHAPTGRIENVGTATVDVAALSAQPGARTATISGTPGSVVLAPDGQGAVFDLSPSPQPLVLTLETGSGDVVLGTVLPTNGTVAFVVDRPEKVRAVRLGAPEGTPLGRAELSG